jgi:hypothetical protein
LLESEHGRVRYVENRIDFSIRFIQADVVVCVEKVIDLLGGGFNRQGWLKVEVIGW